jgi:uncharacterized protein DUF6636
MRVVAAVLLAAALAAGPAGASGQRYGAFKTPSGNIICGSGYGGAMNPAFVECGIASGLKPAPKNTCTDIDYSGKRVSLTATGRAVPVVCAGDPGPFLSLRTARVLAYGQSWNGPGITCTSRRKGLTCRNLRGHGFFLSRKHWRSF